jgi:hypothetical protein
VAALTSLSAEAPDGSLLRRKHDTSILSFNYGTLVIDSNSLVLEGLSRSQIGAGAGSWLWLVEQRMLILVASGGEREWSS